MAERFDVFICHAHEDKQQVARPLAEALKDRNLKVWYDDSALKLGDNLAQSIDKGLTESDFAVVILSPNFFNKSWPKRELDALAAGERQTGVPRILPVWHQVTAKEVARQSPELANRLALDTDEGLEHVAREVSRAVWTKRGPRKSRCVILARFFPDAQKVFSVITEALNRVGVEVTNPFTHSYPSTAGATVLENITSAIEAADFVVADVTDSSPNVLVEVGIAYALRKPVILLVDRRSDTKVPTDLAGYVYLPYDSERIDELSFEFERVARRYADTQGGH